jgi:hypothetical protein
MAEVQHIPTETMTTPTDLNTAGAEQESAEPAATTSHLSPPEATDEPATATALTTTNPEKKIKKIIRKKRRPARPQVDPSTFKNEPPPPTGTIFVRFTPKTKEYHTKHQSRISGIINGAEVIEKINTSLKPPRRVAVT